MMYKPCPSTSQHGPHMWKPDDLISRFCPGLDVASEAAVKRERKRQRRERREPTRPGYSVDRRAGARVQYPLSTNMIDDTTAIGATIARAIRESA